MEILWKLINNNLRAPITDGAGLTALKIRRGSDGFLFDWADLTFKASGWVSLSAPLVDVDAVNLPGLYARDVTVTDWSDGWYQCDLTYSGRPALYTQGEIYIIDGMPNDEAVDVALYVLTHPPEAVEMDMENDELWD